MADLTTVATQGHFGSVMDRIVAIATQGHFDELALESQILRIMIGIAKRTSSIAIAKRDTGDIEIEQSGRIIIDS